MEQVDEQQQQAAAEVDAVHHHQNNSINNHYAGLTQTSKPLTTSMSYFQPPQPTTLDYPIYSALPHRFFFNSNTHNNQNQQQQQQQPYHEVDGIGTTSTYLAAGLLLESCSAASEATAAAFNYGSSNSCSSRWPREETMSLLQIRSRLHSNFKQANHKGPLWDEVSRIMYEEHGYQRSGKKCREKFENLYKYYKKTKEAKSGKHDGKNYRFFRQLEALYGDQNEVIGTNMTDHLAAAQPNTTSSQAHFPPNPAADSGGINNEIIMMRSSAHLFGDSDPQVISPNNHHHNSMKLPCDQSCLSLSNHNSSLFTSSSSEDNKRGHNKKYKLKLKIKEFIDTQMKSLMEQQQLCMEKVMETIEKKETERALREEEWRQEAEERLEKEHKYWESERAWIMKARDAALMETIQKLTAARSAASSSSSMRDVARVTSLASHMQQIPFSSSSGSLINKKPAEFVTVRNPQALYNNNQESQDGWFMAAANHHHHHDSNHNNGFRFVMSDGNNGGSGGSVIWDGSSSFGLKLNNGDDDDHHQN